MQKQEKDLASWQRGHCKRLRENGYVIIFMLKLFANEKKQNTLDNEEYFIQAIA